MNRLIAVAVTQIGDAIYTINMHYGLVDACIPAFVRSEGEFRLRSMHYIFFLC